MPCCIQHAIDTILYHIYIYKYNHYNYHWKDLQCASLKVLFDKRNARTIEMRSHYKKLAYGVCDEQPKEFYHWKYLPCTTPY
jgi:hypothetical protein